MNILHQALLEETNRRKDYFNKLAMLISDVNGFQLFVKYISMDKMTQQIFNNLLSLDINDLVEVAIKFPKLKDSVVSIINHKSSNKEATL